jgi:hypothetical protein
MNDIVYYMAQDVNTDKTYANILLTIDESISIPCLMSTRISNIQVMMSTFINSISISFYIV